MPIITWKIRDQAGNIGEARFVTGWLCNKEYCEAITVGTDGVFVQIRNKTLEPPPRPLLVDASRLFLMSRPPPLQGGQWDFRQNPGWGLRFLGFGLQSFPFLGILESEFDQARKQFLLRNASRFMTIVFDHWHAAALDLARSKS